MTGNLEIRKYKLIELILQLNTEKSIAKLEKEVQGFRQKETFWAAVKPIRKSVSLEQIIKEQNYKPINKQEFYNQVAKISIKEPLDELLGKLTK